MIYLVIALVLIIGWLDYNNKATYNLMRKALDAVHEYMLANIDTLSFEKLFTGYDEMLYSYNYVFCRPWLNSAIKPQYQELLKPFYEES